MIEIVLAAGAIAIGWLSIASLMDSNSADNSHDVQEGLQQDFEVLSKTYIGDWGPTEESQEE